jgi:hypothetical protein
VKVGRYKTQTLELTTEKPAATNTHENTTDMLIAVLFQSVVTSLDLPDQILGEGLIE